MNAAVDAKKNITSMCLVDYDGFDSEAPGWMWSGREGGVHGKLLKFADKFM